MAGTDWIFHTISWALAALAAVLLLWALFADRSRGRKRCPKCWYAMDGVPSLKCPECGHEPRRERALFRTRRRRGWAAAAAAVALAAYGAGITPRVLNHGWPGLVPTAGLVLLPITSEQAWLDNVVLASGTPAPSSKLDDELARRIGEGKVTGPLAAWWLRRVRLHTQESGFWGVTDEDRDVAKRLSTPIEVPLEAASFENVLRTIETTCGVRAKVVDPMNLQEISYTFTPGLLRGPADQLLDLVLSSADFDYASCRWNVRSGELLVGYPEASDARIAVYDLRDLIEREARWRRDGEQTEEHGGDPSLDPAWSSDHVRDLLISNVAFTDWAANGGALAGLTMVDGRALIMTSPREHLRIEAFLEQLRSPASPGEAVSERLRQARDARDRMRQSVTIEPDRTTPAAFALKLSEQIGLPVVLHADRLLASGLHVDMPVDLEADHLPAGLALMRVMRQGSTLPDPFIDWTILGSAAVVTAEQTARPESTWIEVYDVRDLTDAPSPARRNEMVQAVADIVMTNIDFEGWRQAGGDTSSIELFAGCLIISTTPRNHAAIADLLDQLRAGREHAVPTPP